jgi:hypothetical protein
LALGQPGGRVSARGTSRPNAGPNRRSRRRSDHTSYSADTLTRKRSLVQSQYRPPARIVFFEYILVDLANQKEPNKSHSFSCEGLTPRHIRGHFRRPSVQADARTPGGSFRCREATSPSAGSVRGTQRRPIPPSGRLARRALEQGFRSAERAAGLPAPSALRVRLLPGPPAPHFIEAGATPSRRLTRTARSRRACAPPFSRQPARRLPELGHASIITASSAVGRTSSLDVPQALSALVLPIARRLAAVAAPLHRAPPARAWSRAVDEQ